MGARLAGRYEALTDHAENGMRLIEREALPLNPLTDDDVQETMEQLRRIYSDAYGWPAPLMKSRADGAGYQNRMRYKVRAAINEWDILRLYPDSHPETVSDEYRPTYEEDSDIERASEDDSEGMGGAPDAAETDDQPF